MEDINSKVRSKRLELCLDIGARLIIFGDDPDSRAETYAMRAYRDIDSNTLTVTRNLIFETLFTLYDKAGEPELANSYLNKISASATQQWVSAVMSVGLENRYQQRCDPEHAIHELERLSRRTADYKAIDGRSYTYASQTDIGKELKHLWKLFAPTFLPVKDLNTALRKCSGLIARIYKRFEDPAIGYVSMAMLLTITSKTPEYGQLRALFSIFNGPKGEAFWRCLSDYLTGRPPLAVRDPNVKVFCIFYRAIKVCGIEEVQVTDLLSENGDNFSYARNLTALFRNSFDFVCQYGQWLEYLDQAEQGEQFIPENELVLATGLASLPDDFSSQPHRDIPIPDWIYQSAAPSDWAINSIRYLFGIDLPKNSARSRQYAQLLKKTSPPKGAILEAINFLMNNREQRALNILNNDQSHHPGVSLLTADILKKSPDRKGFKKQTDNLESIISHYLKAGDQGLPIGYVRAAEFLVHIKPDCIDSWERAAQYYYKAACRCFEEIDLHQHYLAMAELCKAEAECKGPINTDTFNPASSQQKTASTNQDDDPSDNPSSFEAECPGVKDLSITASKEPALVPDERPSLDEWLMPGWQTVGKTAPIVNPDNEQPSKTQPAHKRREITFWRSMQAISFLMSDEAPSASTLLSAKKQLDELQIPKGSQRWVHAMTAQNKAWCCKKMLEHQIYSNTVDRSAPARRKKGKNSAAKLESEKLPTRSQLISEGLEHLRSGYLKLGIKVPDLKRVMDVEPKALLEREQRQYASLLSTQAHLYSHCGELSTAKALRVLYRRLYTQSHQLRDPSVLQKIEHPGLHLASCDQRKTHQSHATAQQGSPDGFDP